MILDSSVLIAIVQNEPEESRFSRTISASRNCKLSAANLLESHMVLSSRFREAGEANLDALIYRGRIEIVPVSLTQADIARQAFSLYGKGRHSAALNFGDCFAYALAKESGEPLLFKGTDFGQTDIRAVGY